MILVGRTFTVSNQANPLCVELTTNEDFAVEETEVFLVNLSSMDPDIIVITSPTANVTIVDDDGKLNKYLIRVCSPVVNDGNSLVTWAINTNPLHAKVLYQ